MVIILYHFCHFYELYQYQYLRPSFFFQCHHQDSYEFLGKRKKKTELNRGGQAKPTNVVMLGIQDRIDHSKISQGKMASWVFDAKKHH